jgi:hypothetical protein
MGGTSKGSPTGRADKETAEQLTSCEGMLSGKIVSPFGEVDAMSGTSEEEPTVRTGKDGVGQFTFEKGLLSDKHTKS